MKPVRILKSAQADIRAERDYYRKFGPELGQRFQTAVERAILAIPQQPMAMQVLEFNVRRWPVDRGFPHGVLYRVEDGAIVVLAVFHPKQYPKNWRSRAHA